MFSLSDLVRNNNFNEIKIFILNTKKEKGWGWSLDSDDYIFEDACRDAILLGHKKIVKLFLNEGISADACAHVSGGTGLLSLKYFAAKVGNLPMVKLLVAKGAKIKGDRFHDQDAMRAAIEGGHADVVRYLLENKGSSSGVFIGMNDQTFLGRAAFDGQKRIVDLLVQHGARIKSALSLNNEIFRKLYKNYNGEYYSEAEMKERDQKKQELIEKRDRLFQQYSNSVQMILEHAIGTNFDKKEGYSGGTNGGLVFLKGLNIAGFNFVGVSIDGQPITREMLFEQDLKGADKAIVTCDDISHIEDNKRREELMTRLADKLLSEGTIISDNGVVNLVPLADAAKKGLFDVVKVRLSAGINPNQVAKEGLHSIAAIVAAARGGYFEIVRLLAEHPQIDIKTRLTASQAAKNNGHVEIAEYLDSLQDVNEKDHNGNALIHKAVEAKDIEEVNRLLSRGADINLKNGKGLAPLSIAASRAGNMEWDWQASEDDIELLEFLLANGANPNKFKRTCPLALAAKSGSFKAVALLLPVTEKKDLKETEGFGKNKKEISIPWYVPLIFDSYGSKEWLQILSLLKEHGANLNAVSGYSNETILHRYVRGFPSFKEIRSTMRDLQRSIAECENGLEPNPLQKDYESLIEKARKRFTEVLEGLDFLLKNGADPRILCGQDKGTALHVLIQKINLDFIEGAKELVIERLLAHGVDVNTPDVYGSTPLHEAAKTGDLTAASYLIGKGADLNARTKQGRTPLHLAAAGKPRTTMFLIEAGADLDAVDEKGLTPLAYSQKACIDDNRIYVNPTSPKLVKPYHDAQKVLIRASENRRKFLINNPQMASENKCRVEEDYDRICPITFEPFKDPVKAPDGRTYERTAIVEWLKKNGTSPFTRRPMRISQLTDVKL